MDSLLKDKCVCVCVCLCVSVCVCVREREGGVTKLHLVMLYYPLTYLLELNLWKIFTN